MADHPSFSLGLGLTDDEEEEEEQIPSPSDRNTDKQQSDPSFDLIFDEDELDFNQAVVPDSDLDCEEEEEEEPRPFKRLRRGASSAVSSSSSSTFTDTKTPPPPPPPASRVCLLKKECNLTGGRVGTPGNFSSPIDEIEEFSSQEEPHVQDGYMRSAIRDASSCSRISLRNQGVLTSQSTVKIKTKKITPNLISSTLSNLEKSDKTKLLPKLTISPLRKIHVLDTDSDSDKDSGFDHKNNETKLGKERMGNASMDTPALDEFCKEYFRSKTLNAHRKTDEPGTSACSSRDFDPVAFTKEFEDILPKVGSSSECSNKYLPCCKYFNHDDARIKALLKERLPHFTPIGMLNGRDNGQSGRQNLDYMCQVDPKVSAKSRKSKNTRQKDSTPTDVGKRRVQACGQKGQWLTQDGKKIYVTKDGKEMTGRPAYRQYQKESGTKFRRAKKRGTVNRKKGKK